MGRGWQGGVLVEAEKRWETATPRCQPEGWRYLTEGVRTAFFLVEVTTARLKKISELFAQGKLKAEVGSVLPLADVVRAHEMLAGAPHKRGKILLRIGAAA